MAKDFATVGEWIVTTFDVAKLGENFEKLAGPYTIDQNSLESADTLAGAAGHRHDGRDIIDAQVVEDGVAHHFRGEGEGALSAFVDGWTRFSGTKMNVVDYSEHAIGSGTDAEAAAYVQMNIDGKRVAGAAFDQDTVSASLKAVLAAVGRARMK